MAYQRVGATFRDLVTPVAAEDPDGKVAGLKVNADGALVVEATIGDVTIDSADGAIVDGADPAIKATVLDKTNSNPLATAIVDGNGDQITSFGGGTQYTEGDTDSSISGTAMLGEAAANTLQPLQLDANLYLKTAVQSSALPTGAATSAKQPALGTAGTASADVLTVQGIASMTALKVDGSAVTQPVSAASLPLPSGAATSAKQDTSNGSLSSIDLSTASTLSVAGFTSGSAVITDANGTLQQYLRGLVKLAITAGAWLVSVTGTIADDATTPGNPVMVGGMAKSPDGTSPGNVSAEDDVARAITDLNRRLYVNTDHPQSLHTHLDGSSAYTDQSIAAAPGSGLQVIITNIVGSTGAATALNFFLEEGSTKVFGPIYLEAVAGRGFASGPIHLPITANTAVTLTSSAAIAQSFDIDYFIQKV